MEPSKWKGARIRLLGRPPAWEKGLVAAGLVIWWMALLLVGAIGGAQSQAGKSAALEQQNTELVETNENLWYLFQERHCALVACQATVQQWVWPDYPVTEEPAISCEPSPSRSPASPSRKGALEPQEDAASSE